MKWRKATAMAITAVMAVSAGGTMASATEADLDAVTAKNGFPLEEETTLSALMIQLPTVVDLPECTVLQDLEAKTNINLDLTIVPRDGEKEKLNLMLASGEYPEVLIVEGGVITDQDLEKYGVEEGIFLPLNDLIDQYGTNIKQQLSGHPNWEEEMKCSDGNIYGLPGVDSGGSGHGDCSYKLWINTEWLDNLGLSMPETTEEFKEVLRAFKEKDPNGNGIADEIPLTGASGTWAADPYLYLLNAFGYFDENYYYVKDGVVKSILDQDYLQEGLAYIHELYDEGLIDPAAFTQDDAQLAAIGNNSDVAVAGAASCGHIGMFVDINNYDRYSQYEVLAPLEGPSGYRAIPYSLSSDVSGANFVITDVCEHPELAIKLADLFCTEEWAVRAQVGKQGVEWDVADENAVGRDGVTEAKYKYLSYATQSSASQSVNYWDWTWRLIEPDFKKYFQVSGDILDPANYEARLYRDTIALKEYAADVDTLPTLKFSGDDSTAYAQMKTSIGDYAENAIIEFITGARNVESDWDSYLADLDRLGYNNLIELIQKVVDQR